MTPILEVRNLVKTYGSGRSAVRAVDGLSLKIREGSCFGLLGPNGAGKSTTLEIIEGVKKAQSGEILFRGRERTRDFFERIGIQFQSTALQDFMSVREALVTFSKFYRQTADIDALVELCRLGDFLDREHRKLSGGQRQRVLLAIALINDPEILFLDEPTTGLDPQSRVNFWELINSVKSQGKTVVITTHYMDEAFHLCDEIVIVDQGQIIAEGAPERLLSEHFQGKKILLPVAVRERLPQDFPWTVKESQRRLEIHVEKVNDFFRFMADLDLEIDDLEIASKSLEDLFIHLTGKELRDS